MQYQRLQSALRQRPKTWLVTGAAGFIGSNILETLLRLDQNVVALDNFSTGHRENLDEVRDAIGPRRWERVDFIEGDIRDAATCERACAGADFVLHQAALGSVPRSLAQPVASHENNVSGFLNMLVASRSAGVKRFVYASSSSVYGDHPALPKVEQHIGRPLSPYAATKLMDEIYASTFAKAYGLNCVGLRYFNVFGPRQDPAGAYAAVIPRWIAALLEGRPVHIFGDGATSRDFTFVANAVQANLLAATADLPSPCNETFNVACGEATTLNQLFTCIQEALQQCGQPISTERPVYGDFRQGDVRHSLADIQKARTALSYAPTQTVRDGLELAMGWYLQKLRPPTAAVEDREVEPERQRSFSA